MLRCRTLHVRYANTGKKGERMTADEALIRGITQIANKLCERRGYLVRIKEAEVSLVLEAVSLLVEESNRSNGNGAEAVNKAQGS